MDKLKRLRTPIRANISRTANEVDLELKSPIPLVDYLKEKQEKLEELRIEIKPMDKQITETMVDDNCSEPELIAEYQVIDDYNDRIRKTVLQIKNVTEGVQPSYSTFGATGTSSDRSVKLPKIEILKFNGDLKGWLPFWSQFRKIHDDTKMPDSDKFQYLVQSMEKGSSAEEFIGSFTQTGANYPKAVEALRVRYGKEEVLKTVYIRDLLNLITTNAKSVEKMPLSKLYNKLQSQLRSLETLGVSVQQYAIFLHPMVESCLPEEILTAWQRSQNYGKDGTTLNPPKTQLDFLMEFLESEVEAQAMRTLARDGFKPTKEQKKAEKMNSYKDKDDVATAAGLFTGKGQGCIFCSKSHDSKDCGQSKKLSLEEKKAKIQKSGACYLCLKLGHSSKSCKSFVKCLVCDMKHLTLMCPDIHKKPKVDEKDKPEIKTVGENLNCTSEILLQTLLVKVKGKDGHRTARLMIDSGSQMSFVKRKFVKELGIQPIGEEVIRKAVFGGGVTEPRVHHKYRLNLKGLEDLHSTNKCQITVLDEPVVCGRIPRAPPGPWMDELRKRNIRLSDTRSPGNADIDILVGVDFMGMLMTGKVHQLDCGLYTAETTLGWTFYSKVPSRCDDSFASLVATTFMADASVEDLWNLESIGIRECSESLSKEENELAAKEHFAKTVTRNEDGRYTVSLPWITEDQEIPVNRKVAEARLKGATNKLKNGHAFETYDGIFKQWLAEGIIEEVPQNQNKKASHYVPHRPVFKPESLTTPVRPVFDASCKTGRSPSLNDCLEKGPNIMELIPSLILRFRERKIDVLSDIRKAFQMINLNEKERDFLRFLWWEDDDCSKIKEFRHSRVVFGVNCSPFLLAAVIEKHLCTAQGEMKTVAQKLLQSLYVDNCVTSVDSYEEYEDFKNKATQLMAEAKMELRQWEHSIGEGTGVGPTMEPGCGLGPSNVTASTLTSVLGLKWDKSKDELFCIVPKSEINERITKRVILSSIQKIFDPMGFLAPALLPPKRMMQKAWAKEVSWDEQLDEQVEKDFKSWWCEAAKLETIRIPRWSTGGSFVRADLQLHIFCDASQDAFAAVVFIRAEKVGEVSVQLLQAKARVAPLKKITIPRLELLSCTIAARLSKSVSRALGLDDIRKFYWCDSTTALAWIKRNNDWGTFVGNRVREICHLTNTEDWRHVPGVLNPADLPSRGCTPRELLESKWWEGPEWLKDSMEMWPSCKPETDEKDVAVERKKTAILLVNLVNGESPWYCRRFSSYLKNVRVVAWMIRFIHKSRKTSKVKGELHEDEINAVEQLIFGLIQGEGVASHVKEGILEGIRVQIEDGLIVVKTKLLNRQDNVTFVKPAVLPSQHTFVEQMIREEHLKNHHAGVQFLMSKLREKCWIHRRKGKQPHVFKIGDIVHIGADNKKRLEWPLGKIVELLPGKDGKVRVAKVKTSMGVLLRPLQRLFPLEISAGEKELPASESVRKLATESAARREVESVSTESTAEVRTRKGRLVKPPVRHGYSNISYKLLI